MQSFNLARAAVMRGTMAAWLLLATACGGGGSDPNADAPGASSSSAEVPIEQATGYTVVATELLSNGQFADGTTGWVPQDATLIASELRAGGKALNVGWTAKQTLSATAIEPGKSYTLLVKARADRAGSTAEIAMRFRKPAYSESIRTYKATVVATTYQDYQIDFTAPPYAGMAEVSFTGGNGAHVIVDSASLKMRSAIVLTEPIVSTAGSYVPSGYTLVFNDEFSGGSLNRSKWFTRYIAGGETVDHLNDEQQRYRDNNNHVLAGGVLNLVARKVSSNALNGVNYESGMIRSDWTTQYGYFEARVKMPGGLGVWPAFWLNSDVNSAGRLSWPPEIDIFEFVNNGVEDRVNMLHMNVVKQTSTTTSTILYADPAFNTSINDYIAPFNFNEGWHTIGLLWETDKVTMYVDGLKICTRPYQWVYADGTLAGPAHILLNLAIGGSWAGRHGIDDSAFPQALQVDWVQAYKKTS